MTQARKYQRPGPPSPPPSVTFAVLSCLALSPSFLSAFLILTSTPSSLALLSRPLTPSLHRPLALPDHHHCLPSRPFTFPVPHPPNSTTLTSCVVLLPPPPSLAFTFLVLSWPLHHCPLSLSPHPLALSLPLLPPVLLSQPLITPTPPCRYRSSSTLAASSLTLPSAASMPPQPQHCPGEVLQCLAYHGEPCVMMDGDSDGCSR